MRAVTAASETLGAGGIGNVVQSGTGSTNTVAGTLTIGAASSYQLAAGTLSIGTALINNGNLSGQGTLRIGSSTALQNNGSWGVGGLVVGGTASLANSGSLTETGALLLANSGANTNTGNWSLAGYALQLTGATLTNNGAFSFGSAAGTQFGSVSGTGTLVNGAAGSITGPGTISSQFANAGTVALGSGSLAISSAFTNAGQILLASNGALLGGGTITNTGTLGGFGSVGSGLVNQGGTVNASGGTLSLNGAVSNAGTFTIDNGAKLLVRSGLATNAGAIQLAGGTFDNNGVALANSGTITGFGTVRTGGLTNNGYVEFSGGTTAVYGAVTGSSGSQTILSGAGNATFYGAVNMLSGSELRVSTGTVATFFGSVDQHAGALFTGTGQSNYEGQVIIGNATFLGAALTAPSSGLLRNSGGLTLIAPVDTIFNAGSVTFGSTSTVISELGALGTGASYDELVVGGQLTLGGKLMLVTAAGFSGQAGDSFRLFSAASQSGQFDAIDLSQAQLGNGLAWDTSQLASTGTVSIMAAAPAVPLPPSIGLLAGGVGLLGLLARRRLPQYQRSV